MTKCIKKQLNNLNCISSDYSLRSRSSWGLVYNMIIDLLEISHDIVYVNFLGFVSVEMKCYEPSGVVPICKV